MPSADGGSAILDPVRHRSGKSPGVPDPGSDPEILADRYALLAPLGTGGFGDVYRARRLSDGVTLALKVQKPAPSGAPGSQLARVADALARLRHPNIVTVHDVGVTADGRTFQAMDLVDGQDLSEHKHRYGDVPWVLPVLAQVSEGLAAVHAAGLVHCDLKPRNVMLSPADHEAPTARIVDFGAARLMHPPDTACDEAAPPGDLPPSGAPADGEARPGVSAVVGTPVFLAPELHGAPQRVRPALDLFAFGVLAHQVLTNLLPFAEPPIFVWAREKRLPELLPLDLRCPALPARASAVLMQCLDPDPDHRPPAEKIARTLHDA